MCGNDNSYKTSLRSRGSEKKVKGGATRGCPASGSGQKGRTQIFCWGKELRTPVLGKEFGSLVGGGKNLSPGGKVGLEGREHVV